MRQYERNCAAFLVIQTKTSIRPDFAQFKVLDLYEGLAQFVNQFIVVGAVNQTAKSYSHRILLNPRNPAACHVLQYRELEARQSKPHRNV